MFTLNIDIRNEDENCEYQHKDSKSFSMCVSEL